jgi:hypothetical protein
VRRKKLERGLLAAHSGKVRKAKAKSSVHSRRHNRVGPFAHKDVNRKLVLRAGIAKRRSAYAQAQRGRFIPRKDPSSWNPAMSCSASLLCGAKECRG